MRLLYSLLAILIVLLGLVHVASTPRFFAELDSEALWFASAGLTLVLTGALNLLNRAYGNSARGLLWTCVAANVAVLAYSTLAGYAGGASAAELALVLGLLGATTLLSLLPVARAGPESGRHHSSQAA